MPSIATKRILIENSNLADLYLQLGWLVVISMYRRFLLTEHNLCSLFNFGKFLDLFKILPIGTGYHIKSSFFTLLY